MPKGVVIYPTDGDIPSISQGDLATPTQLGVGLRNGITGSIATLTGALTGPRSYALPNAAGTFPLLESTQVFTGADTFRNSAGIRSETASTQDAIVVAGRAGGSTSLAITLAPDTLTASATQTLQNIAGVHSLNLFVGTADVTVANTVSALTIVPTGTGVTTLPASFLKIGKTIRITISGYCGNTAAPTITFVLSLGGTTIASIVSPAINIAANYQFTISANITCRTTGAAGTVVAGGAFNSNGNMIGLVKTTTTTIDTTITQAIGLTAQWSVANAANTITTQIMTIEALN